MLRIWYQFCFWLFHELTLVDSIICYYNYLVSMNVCFYIYFFSFPSSSSFSSTLRKMLFSHCCSQVHFFIGGFCKSFLFCLDFLFLIIISNNGEKSFSSNAYELHAFLIYLNVSDCATIYFLLQSLRSLAITNSMNFKFGVFVNALFLCNFFFFILLNSDFIWFFLVNFIHLEENVTKKFYFDLFKFEHFWLFDCMRLMKYSA